jgi:hypothetical protein
VIRTCGPSSLAHGRGAKDEPLVSRWRRSRLAASLRARDRGGRGVCVRHFGRERFRSLSGRIPQRPTPAEADCGRREPHRDDCCRRPHGVEGANQRSSSELELPGGRPWSTVQRIRLGAADGGVITSVFRWVKGQDGGAIARPCRASDGSRRQVLSRGRQSLGRHHPASAGPVVVRSRSVPGRGTWDILHRRLEPRRRRVRRSSGKWRDLGGKSARRSGDSTAHGTDPQGELARPDEHYRDHGDG